METKNKGKPTLVIEILGKRSGIIDARIPNNIQKIEGRISGAEDAIENIDTATTYPNLWDTMKAFLRGKNHSSECLQEERGREHILAA
jgi:hypothetical protein